MVNDKNDRRVGRRMLAVYKEKDAEINTRAEAIGSKCGRGCADCCNLTVTITFPEAVAIAEHILTNPEFYLQQNQIHTELAEQIRVHLEGFKQRNPRYYFDQKIPCVFLDKSTKECRVYDVRPATCRSHHVATDPTLCSSDNKDQPVGRIDMDKINNYMNLEALRVSKQANLPLWIGPLQIMVSWAFKLLREGRESVANAHIGLSDGDIMNLNFWRLRPPTQTTVEIPIETLNLSFTHSDTTDGRTPGEGDH